MNALKVVASWLSTLVVVPAATGLGVVLVTLLAVRIPAPASVFVIAATFMAVFCGVGMAFVGAPRWPTHVALITLVVLMVSTPGVLGESGTSLRVWAGELGGGALGLGLARRVGS